MSRAGAARLLRVLAMLVTVWSLPATAGEGAGEGCKGEDPGFLCLALRYVAYKDPAGAPVIAEATAAENLRQVNSVFARCGMGFRIESFESVAPVETGLAYRTANLHELDAIRSRFASDTMLLVATTGPWDRGGTLGRTPANAWTSLPGSAPFGVILEKPVGNYPNIVAHELGHYLNLLHTRDRSNLMNSVIYTSSTALTQAQCATARSTAANYWGRMLR